MPIPALNGDGCLPEGIHDATIEEIAQFFGRPDGSRARLVEKLRAYHRELLDWGHAHEVLVDGSFVTDKAEPGDIDLIVILEPEFDIGAAPTPAEYNLFNHARARRFFGFDVFYMPADSQARQLWIEVYGRDKRGVPKGFVRLTL
jgi:hypothetical protein